MQQSDTKSKRGGSKLGILVTVLSLVAVSGAVLVRSAWASAGQTTEGISPMLLTMGLVGSVVGTLLVWMHTTADRDESSPR